jgi:hypothetical protein
MDITTLAAWGEFLGGIAVVVSLVYLASQIRQNSKLLRASTASASVAANNSSSTLIAGDPELARIYWDGLVDRSSLPEADRRRFDPLLHIFFAGWNQEYQFAEDGVVGPAVWENRRNGMLRLLQQPGMTQWWDEWGDTYGSDFVEFVNGLIREGEADG